MVTPKYLLYLTEIFLLSTRCISPGFLGGPVLENPPTNAGDIGDVGLILGLERSPREGNGYPL